MGRASAIAFILALMILRYFIRSIAVTGLKGV